MAQAIQTRFHISAFIPILMGLAGAGLSLFWDVIYRGRPFSMAAVGPYKLAGVAAGIALAVAGLTLGIVVGRRASARTGPEGARSMSRATMLIGALLIFGGLGGTFLSLLWDVVRRGRAFSAAAVGPFKLVGIAAGIALAAIGIVMVFVLARKRPAAKTEAAAHAAISPEGAQDKPVQAPPQQAAMPGPGEEIPFAYPVEQSQPLQAGTAPMEAIPVED